MFICGLRGGGWNDSSFCWAAFLFLRADVLLNNPTFIFIQIISAENVTETSEPSDKLPSPLTVFCISSASDFRALPSSEGNFSCLSRLWAQTSGLAGGGQAERGSKSSSPAPDLHLFCLSESPAIGCSSEEQICMSPQWLLRSFLFVNLKQTNLKLRGLSLACTWQPCTPATQIKLCHFVEHKP